MTYDVHIIHLRASDIYMMQQQTTSIFPYLAILLVAFFGMLTKTLSKVKESWPPLGQKVTAAESPGSAGFQSKA